MFKFIKRFYQFLLRYRWQYLVFLVVLIISATLENLNPYFYKLFIDAIPQGDFPYVFRVLALYVFVRLIMNLLSSLGQFIGDQSLIPAARDARLTIFRQVQDLDFAYHATKSTGSLISAFKRGDAAFFELFHDLHYGVGYMIISFAVLLFFFVGISPPLALVMVVGFTLNLLIGARLIKLNIREREAFNKEEDKISAVITDNLINYETVKLFAQETKEEARLSHKFVIWLKKLWGYANSFRLIDIIVGSVSTVSIGFVLYLSVRLLQKGQIGSGDLIMIAGFSTGFYYQFFNLMYRLRGLAKRYVDIDRYFGILDQEILIKDPQLPQTLSRVRGKIVFDKVGFSYPEGQKDALKNFSLTVKAGESIALVGRSGAGKTTAIKLLLRFFDVDKGSISLDGVDIRNFTKSRLRSFIGVVPQEPILFNNTIKFNLAYANPQANFAQIKEAAKVANIHDFIITLPKKYQTQVGERGIRLSGGQKQRLAIARMLLSKPKVIVFDEATSNLDSESEGLIQDALWKMAQKRTVFIIAHRFATIQKASRIVVMEKGQIKEVGSHRQLVTQNGLYAHLWKLQVKGQLRSADLDENFLSNQIKE